MGGCPKTLALHQEPAQIKAYGVLLSKHGKRGVQVQARFLRPLLHRTPGRLLQSVTPALSPRYLPIPPRELWQPFLLLRSHTLLVLPLPPPKLAMAGRIPPTLQVEWWLLQRAAILIHGLGPLQHLRPFVASGAAARAAPDPLITPFRRHQS